MTLGHVDHLISAVPALAAGIDDLERRLGVRAVVGGAAGTRTRDRLWMA